MKNSIRFCETCGYESKDAEDMRKHEASHLGLTVEEMDQYRAMKSFAAYMGSVVFNKKSEETETKYDEAINAVIDFEKKHGIKNESIS